MPNRTYTNGTEYKYGFNGKEKDNSTGEGNLDFGARVLDVRLARWLSVDLKWSKYPAFTPYNFVANNTINAIDPDGKDIIFLIALANANATSKNNMFIKSAETRKKDIENSKGFDSKKDKVVILQIQDVASIKCMLYEKVKELSPAYGKTIEVGIYSHNGEKDGPIGTESSSEYKIPGEKNSLQMTQEGWSAINWNWKENSANKFTLFGCNSAKDFTVDEENKHNNFASNLSKKDNMSNVLVAGLDVSSYPSIYVDKRVYTSEMESGNFSKASKVYMVGSDGGFGDYFFNRAYSFRTYMNGEYKGRKQQPGATEPEYQPKVIK